jgi:hypothetical protein
MSIDKPPMAAVRIIGIIGRTSDIRAETHPVSASAASTTAKVAGCPERPGNQHDRQPGQQGAGREGGAYRERVTERCGARGCRDAVLRLGVSGQRIVGRQLDRDPPGQAGRKAARHIQRGELIELRIGRGLVQRSFGGKLSRLPVLLGAQLGVFNGSHGQRSGHEPGEPGK